MRWQWWVGLAVTGVVTAATGCRRDQALLAADPDLLRAIARSGQGEPADLSRAQKPDGKPSPLKERPERSADIANLPPAAQIGVTVNGQPILNEEIIASCYHELVMAGAQPEGARRQKEIFLAARDQLIDREVVLQDAFERLGNSSNKAAQRFLDKLKEAASKEFEKSWLRLVREKSNTKTDEEFKEYLRARGISLEMQRRQWERQFMAMEYLRSKIYSELDKIGHQQIAEYYQTHTEEFQVSDEVEWQDIFILASRHPTRDAALRFAEVLAARARAGEDFVKLAEQFDNGDSSLRQAAGIGHKRGEIRPGEAEEALFRLRDGEVGPIIEIPSGFHVIRVVQRTFAGVKPFDEKTQKQIRDKLRNEIGSREMKYIVNDLKRKAIIEYAAGVD